jgi:hypothetical protein
MIKTIESCRMTVEYKVEGDEMRRNLACLEDFSAHNLKIRRMALMETSITPERVGLRSLRPDWFGSMHNVPCYK